MLEPDETRHYDLAFGLIDGIAALNDALQKGGRRRSFADLAGLYWRVGTGSKRQARGRHFPENLRPLLYEAMSTKSTRGFVTDGIVSKLL